MRAGMQNRVGAVAIATLLTCVLQAQVPGETPTWHAGAHSVRQVSASTPDSVPVPLLAGQFVRVEVMQTGIDVVVTFRDPEGRPLFEVDSDNGNYGPETVVAIADSAGIYRLEVKADSGSGSYEMRILDLRPAVPEDKELITAHRSYAMGQKLRERNSRETRPQAIEKLEAAVAFFRQNDDHYIHALALYSLGFTQGQSGDFRKALASYEEAAALLGLTGDRRMEAAVRNNEGGALDVLGESQRALQAYRQALDFYVADGDRTGEAMLLNNIGLAQGTLADWRGALDSFRQALVLDRELADGRREGLVLMNMGVAYQKLGDRERALELLDQALPLQRAARDQQGEAITLLSLANLQLSLNQAGKAIDHVDQSIAAAHTLGDRRLEAWALEFRGEAYTSLRRFEEAEDALQQCLGLARSLGSRLTAGGALLALARVSLLTGQTRNAVERGEQSLTEFRAVGDTSHEGMALEMIARAESVGGNLPEARRRMEEALRVNEATRQGTNSEQLRASFFATRQDAYGFYIDLLMRTGAVAEALETSERSRARSLVEMLAESGSVTGEGPGAELLQRQRDIANRLNAKGARLLQLGRSDPQVAALSQDIRNLETEYQDLQAAIRESNPRYAALTQPRLLTAKQIQTELLDSDTLLMEYSLGEERSYLWTVGTNGINSWELPARLLIEDKVRELSQLLSLRSNPAVAAVARELSEMIFGKAGPLLGNRRLLIVPDGGLQYVPFSMLPLPGSDEPLVVRHEVVIAPSASALAVLRAQAPGRKQAPRTLAVFADPVFDVSDSRVGGRPAARAVEAAPPETARLLEHLVEATSSAGGALHIPRLPYTAQEAEQILGVAPDASNWKAIGFDASRASALSGRLSEYRYLHFATHGFLDTERPQLSALVLSQIDAQSRPEDGFLRVNDIYNVRLSADLVVLSACQTGLGKEVRGEGLMGLTRAFFYAGVPRVIVSLWNVNDRATAELMAGFYKKMLREGKRPSEALRLAQLDLRKQKRWASPYYWAAFVQQGDWN